MAEKRRRATRAAVGEGTAGNPSVVLDLSADEVKLARLELRKRWELATVIHFLNVFEKVIERKMKVSAEEIEEALITPNRLLSELHIALLKGIPPINNKSLNGSDAWVTVLCKKLSPWWPWVSEGNIPLTASKGEEISRYKELDPTARLQLLRALCEIRADQDDVVAYMNDALKVGTKVPFRKDKIAGDAAGTVYWCDGSTDMGYRLYKEVRRFEFKQKAKGEVCLPNIISEWETLATNLEEFQEVVDQFSSSEVEMEVTVAKAVETDVLPILEKLQKKKEKVIKQQQRQEILLNGFHNSGITRSCRNRRPVNYTFDDYDKTINEAIQLTKRSKTSSEEQKKPEEKPVEQAKEGEAASNNSERSGSESDSSKSSRSRSSDNEQNSGNTSADKQYDVASNTESEEERQESNDDDDDDDEQHDSQEEDGNYEEDNHSGDSEMEKDEVENKNRGKSSKKKKTGGLDPKSFGCRWSTRLAKGTNPSVPETKHMGANNRTRQRPTRNSALDESKGAKNRTRQRPMRNSALQSQVVSDSEDEHISGSSSGSGKSSSTEVSEDSDN